PARCPRGRPRERRVAARPRCRRRPGGSPAVAAGGRGGGAVSRPADWEPCSDSSLRRGDPLDGSGSRGLRWLMVELAGPWGYSALLDSPGLLPPELGREIAGRAQEADVRVAAIRRPGRR